ncbi:MAG TPA: hypothetical protein VEI02_14680, partial [Planctomycetota bacterium]|nr:hypothetical protein [Planctomycetota bacterium]
CGLEFKLPSYFAATGDGDYEHVDVRTLNAVSPTFHMISFEERRPIQDDGFIEANAEGFKTTPAAFKPCKTPLGPGLALRTEPDGARGRRLVRFLQTSGRVVRISILTGGGNSADLEAVLDRLIASLKSAP